jgi:hypothetical protein
MEADGVPRLVLKRSELRAGSSAWFPDYTCAAVVWPYVAPAAVSAPGALVIVQDSLLVGGNGIRYCFGGVDQCSTENPWQTGQGGPGLVADRLYYRRSTFTGGSGDSWTNRPEIGAAGAPFVVNDVDEIVGNRRHAR